jgi:hypothetical protein
LDLADFRPWDALFLHLVGDQASITVFKGGFLDLVRAKQANERNHVLDGEVFHFRGIVEREDRVPLSQKRQEDHAAGPYVHCRGLLSKVEQGFWRHIAFGACAILNFYLALQMHDLLHLVVVLVLSGVASLVAF